MPAERLDLADLAARYDPDSRDTYLSVFVDLADGRHETALDERAKQIRAALGERARVEAFDVAFRQARKALAGLRRGPEARGAAVFVAPEHGFVEAHVVAASLDTQMVLDSSPYIRPLARFADEYEEFVLVLLDGEEGVVYLVEEGRAEERGDAEMSLIGRHKKGGMSQRRYQRHRQGRVDSFFDEMIAVVEALVRDGEADRIVIAGPGHPKKQFVSRLPAHLAEHVVAVEDVDFNGASDDVLVRQFVDLAKRLEAQASVEKVGLLRESLLTGTLATTGAFDVVRAARDGRVATLVILKGVKLGGAKCEEHQSFFAADGACEVCGASGNQVDLVNEALEYCVRADSDVEFVDKDAFLEQIGGVGAVLRW